MDVKTARNCIIYIYKNTVCILYVYIYMLWTVYAACLTIFAQIPMFEFLCRSRDHSKKTALFCSQPPISPITKYTIAVGFPWVNPQVEQFQDPQRTLISLKMANPINNLQNQPFYGWFMIGVCHRLIDCFYPREFPENQADLYPDHGPMICSNYNQI